MACVVEGSKVIGIILKEGALAVGSLQGTPVVMPPVAVVAETNILDRCVGGSCADWDDQVLRTVRHGYATAVAPCLLDIVLMLIDLCCICLGQSHIIRYRSQVGGREREQVWS